MYKLAYHVLLSVTFICSVALHGTNNKNDIEYFKSVDIQERGFNLGQTMADHVVYMTIDYVKIAGSDKAKQERLGSFWGQEIIRAIDKEIDSLLSSLETDFTPEQAALLKARVTEDKKGLQRMAESMKEMDAQAVQLSHEEEKSAKNAYALGTTCAHVYWLLNTTGVMLANTNKNKTEALEVVKNIVLQLIAGVTTQLESCTKKEFLDRYQLSKEQEHEYSKLIRSMTSAINSAQTEFIVKFSQAAH